MAINILTKAPGDSRRFKFDCKKALSPGEQITGNIQVTPVKLGRVHGAANVTVGSVGDARPRYTDDAIYIELSGGTDEEDYRVTVQFQTNQSSSVQVTGDLRVRSDI